MRGIWSTLALVVVLAGLGGYIYFVDSKRPASTSIEGEPARTKVFTVEADKVNEIRLTVQGSDDAPAQDRRGLADDRAHGGRRRSAGGDRPGASHRQPRIGPRSRGQPFGPQAVRSRRAADHRRVQGRGRRVRIVQAGQQERDAGRDLRVEGRRRHGVPGVGVPGIELQPRAVRAARQEDPEVRSREGRHAGAGQGRQRHRAGAHRQRLAGRQAGGVAQRLQRRGRLHHAPLLRKHVDAGGRERQRISRSTGSTSRR